MWTPPDLGFPEPFQDFRDAQIEAIEHVLTSEKRFIGIGAPPGVGKSAIAFALAKLLGGRTVILTATLGLQDQYVSAFSEAGLVDIRGRGNYPCWCGGTCEDGGRLNCADKEGCPYLSRFRQQQASDIVSTSYAYWIAINEKGNGMRAPDTLICDEAGIASEWLSRSLDFTIGEKQARLYGHRFAPLPGEDHDTWLKLAPVLKRVAERAYERAKVMQNVSEIRRAERFQDACTHLDLIEEKDNWVISREDGTDDGRLWRFECIWPGRYRENLFRGIQRVILMSATLRPKTLSLLGIKASDCDFREWGRQFPLVNGPVIWVPTVRVRADEKMTPEEKRIWLDRLVEIVQLYPEQKGLSQTVSYKRATEIEGYFRSKGLTNLVLNGSADPDSKTATQAFEKHVTGKLNSHLISPSFSTGWDFKYKAAEYQIIPKLPIKDMRSKIMQARRERDRGYEDYHAAQEFVQSSGRINRDFDDRGTTYLADDSWTWFRGRAEDHMPKWFKVRREETLPPPLQKL